MREEEARTKWCFASIASHRDPRAKGVVARDGTFRSDSAGNYQHACIASDCMAWRSQTLGSLRAAQEFAAAGQPIFAIKALREAYPDGEAPNLKEAKDIVESGRWPTAGGYCGLAGAPRS